MFTLYLIVVCFSFFQCQIFARLWCVRNQRNAGQRLGQRLGETSVAASSGAVLVLAIGLLRFLSRAIENRQQHQGRRSIGDVAAELRTIVAVCLAQFLAVVATTGQQR